MLCKQFCIAGNTLGRNANAAAVRLQVLSQGLWLMQDSASRQCLVNHQCAHHDLPKLMQKANF